MASGGDAMHTFDYGVGVLTALALGGALLYLRRKMCGRWGDERYLSLVAWPARQARNAAAAC